MTNEEKQAIERLETEIYMLPNATIDAMGKENYKRRSKVEQAIITILNLVETQAKELEKKDKMIELMGKLLYEHRNSFGWYEVGTDIESVEKQIEYFKREVEDGNKNTEIG